MRKILFLLIVLISSSVEAAHISLVEATNIAADFFGETESYPCHASLRNAPSIDKAYYIFTSRANDAFVILSGDTRMPQILAFSRDNGLDIENIPPQLPDFLNSYVSFYNYVIHTDTDISTKASVKSTPVLYQTCKWGQGVPFNSLCPTSYTGCGATAMAIKMKYHNYPAKGTGSHFYDWSGRSIGMNFDFDFNFSLMNSDFIAGSYTQLQADAVAKLMYACGISVDMNYGTEESSCDLSSFVMMAKYFGYSDDIQFIQRNGHSNETWFRLLDKELEDVGPVIYRGAGSDNSEGHIFLIDGKNENGYYHVNWGWNGSYNGFFLIDALTPGSSDFSYNECMIINAIPESTGIFSPMVVSSYDGGHGLSYNKERIVADESFFTGVSRLENRDNESHKGSLALAITDKSGNIKRILNEGSFDLRPGYGYRSYIFPNTKSIVDATENDMLTLLYRSESDNEWREVKSGYDTKSSVSAWDFTPEFVKLKWDIDPDISVVNTNHQYMDKALKYATYYFKIKYDSWTVEPLVTVNDEPITPSESWYAIPFANLAEYTIKISNIISGAGEIIDDNTGAVIIYSPEGQLICVASDYVEAMKVLSRYPKGIYLLRQGNKIEKLLN